MKRTRQFLVLLAGGIGAAALLGSPIAAADEYGGGGANNPLLPGCETMGGSSVLGGQSTDCASPGNSQVPRSGKTGPALMGNPGHIGPTLDALAVGTRLDRGMLRLIDDDDFHRGIILFKTEIDGLE